MQQEASPARFVLCSKLVALHSQIERLSNCGARSPIHLDWRPDERLGNAEETLRLSFAESRMVSLTAEAPRLARVLRKGSMSPYPESSPGSLRHSIGWHS